MPRSPTPRAPARVSKRTSNRVSAMASPASAPFHARRNPAPRPAAPPTARAPPQETHRAAIERARSSSAPALLRQLLAVARKRAPRFNDIGSDGPYFRLRRSIMRQPILDLLQPSQGTLGRCP